METLSNLLKGAFRTVIQLILLSFIFGYLLGSYMSTVKTLDRDMEVDLWRAPAFFIMMNIEEDNKKYREYWYFKDTVRINPAKAELHKKLFQK